MADINGRNFDNPDFMNKVFERLPSLHDNLLIFGGDMNCVIDPRLDRSSLKSLTPSLMSSSLSL